MGTEGKKAGYGSTSDPREGPGEAAIMVKSEPLLKQEMRTRGSLDPASLPPDTVKRTEVVRVRGAGFTWRQLHFLLATK